MDTRQQDKALKVALDAAKKGGAITLKYFRRLKFVSIKEGAGLVSEADKESEAVITKIIHKAYPTHQVLGEEAGYSGSDRAAELWVVDPLDGTTNYVHGFPFYCVSIGLEVNGVVEVGVVYAPLLKQIYTAIRGRGAFLNGKPIHVSGTDRIEDSLLATGFSYSRNEYLDQELRDFRLLAVKARGIRRAGSAALDMCMVASGVYDGFWERQLAPWDTAAGCLLVTEAGGVVTNFENDPFHFSMKSVLAANPNMHPLIQQTIQNK
ncbi:MAG: inositol monophosphatase family protein [Oligoflexia bacterium]|nr:inositol monophosphatase family protein [Oligoflexia bacterium]